MKKALVIANMLFASATVFGMENSQIQGNSEQFQRVNNTVVNETTPLISAVKARNTDLVGTLIQGGVDVDERDSSNQTALSIAVDSNDVSITQLLVNKGNADIYANGVFDRAMTQGSDEIKEILTDANFVYLVKAVKNNDIAGVKRALNHDRTRVNEKFYKDEGAKGYTPLMYAASRGNLGIINLLLNSGARVNVVSDSEDNALFFAARNGKTEALKTLMSVSIGDVKEAVARSNKKEDLKRNINRVAIATSGGAEIALARRNNLGQTLLISALKNGREDMAIWLINQGANVNDTCEGESALMIASKYGQVNAIELLLAKGASIDFSNKNGTVLDYILQSNEGTLTTELKDQFAKILIDRGIQIDRPKKLLFWSARNGYLEMTKSLLNRVDNINFRNQNNETPFMVALKEKHLGVSEVLFSDEVNLDEAYVYTNEERDYRGNIIQTTYEGTILTWAARNTDSDVMEWLIRHEANLDVMETIRKHCESKWGSTTRLYRESLLSIVQKRLKRRVFDMMIYYDSLESIVDMFRKAEAAAR
ncbi:MAG: ankyrin repeat domain-containing protein [Bacteroidales bacterium]|nr:ankyrin repeat domain-containing protein [Bacteroidales bacterium]